MHDVHILERICLQQIAVAERPRHERSRLITGKQVPDRADVDALHRNGVQVVAIASRDQECGAKAVGQPLPWTEPPGRRMMAPREEYPGVVRGHGGTLPKPWIRSIAAMKPAATVAIATRNRREDL